jgi:hypothetical protein
MYASILRSIPLAIPILALSLGLAATAPQDGGEPGNAPRIHISAPAEGEVFSAPADIRVNAIVQYAIPWAPSVAFHVDGERVGSGRPEIPIAALLPPDAPVNYPFRWRDAQPGAYTITAETRLADGTFLRSEPVTVRVEPPASIEPSLEIRRPADGAEIPAGGALDIDVVGVGRYGGITDVALIVDGEKVDESHIAFVRAPEAYEPVSHSFTVAGLEPGTHRLEAVDLSDSTVIAPPMTIRVLEDNRAERATLRLNALADGTLLLVLDPGEDPARATFEIQSSTDLREWTVIGRSDEGALSPLPRAPAPQSGSVRFLRAVRAP